MLGALERIGIAVTPKRLHMHAGDQATVSVTVTNHTMVLDELSLAVEGLDPTWYTVRTTTVSLDPGDSGQVAIDMHLPTQMVTPTGAYPAVLRVTSESDPRNNAACNLLIQVDRVGLEVIPRRLEMHPGNRASIAVAITNGRTEESEFKLVVDGLDPGWYSVQAETVKLLPGTQGRVFLDVHPPDHPPVPGGVYPALLRVFAENDRRDYTVVEVPVQITSSSFLEYLPDPYQRDPFVGRFLRIPDSIISPIEVMIDQLASYFDPRLTPAQLLPWLASWVGLELDENWPLAKRRLLTYWAARLYRWRGTRRALRQHLWIYTGRTPLIVENFDGLRLGQDGALGINTRIGVPRNQTIAVTVLVDRAEEVDEQAVRAIIETEKPVHTAYTLAIYEVGGTEETEA